MRVVTIKENLEIRNKETPLRKLAQILYDMRSKFVHEAQFVLGFGAAITVGLHDGHVLVNKLTMNDLRLLFERGFLKRFGWKADTQQCNSPEN